MGENRSVCMRWGGSWCVYAMGRIVVCVCDAWDGTVAAVAAAVKSRQEVARKPLLPGCLVLNIPRAWLSLVLVAAGPRGSDSCFRGTEDARQGGKCSVTGDGRFGRRR